MFKNIYRSSNFVRKSSATATKSSTNSTPSSTITTNSQLLITILPTSKTTTTTTISTTITPSPPTLCLNLRCISTKTSISAPTSPTNKKDAQNSPFIFNSSQTPFFTRSNSCLTRSMSTEATAASTSKDKSKHTNRLAQEKSPYLLQHAHNPVDWYPWGEEAIERARRENKLIFLSVGYSTCHWCHVMERESFENEAVAAIMNANFINVKVDREERPDIDKIYMQFVMMINGSGGWPMSVWITPDLAPITAGTYFPPHNRWGMPSFTTVLNSIATKWSANQEELKSTGHQVIKAIQKTMTEREGSATFEPGSADAKLKEALNVFKRTYDQLHGGFGTKPKFPEVSRLNFLFHAYITTKDIDVLDMVLQSLKHIGNGGIHDHVFGGFARYSVDREWHVPHFEKMLYDQGQLMAAYANAYKITNDEKYLMYADGIFRYLMKDLHHPLGGFFSGEDADSLPKADDDTKVEGAFYAWTWNEIKDAINANVELFKDIGAERAFEIYAFYYSVKPTGNVEPTSDPHGHLNGKNILIVRDTVENTCTEFDITAEQLIYLTTTSNEILHKIRDKRPRPHLDTKIICSWNGLVLSGLSKLANCGSVKREEYMNAAKQLVDFLRQHVYVSDSKTLLRSVYGNGIEDEKLESVPSERIDGFLDDYAFLIKGLLDYYKASLDNSVLRLAKDLQDKQDELFWDNKNSAYFYSQANSPNVIVRLKEDHDGAEPCGNSVSTRNLILLSHYFDEESYSQRAGELLQFFADINPFGYSLPEMMCGLLLHEHGLDLVAVVGPDTEGTKRMVEICRRFYIPGMIILHVNPETPNDSYSERIQKKFKMVNGKPTVYMCHDKVCRMPVTDPEKLEQNLKENYCKTV